MLGTNIKRFRIQKKMKQIKLAERVGLRQESLSRIESGKLNPSIATLRRIAKELDVSLAELFEETA